MRPTLLGVLLLFGACSSCAYAGMRGTVAVDIKGDVLSFAASVQREFSVETVLCLTGEERKGTVYVRDVRLAGVRPGASRTHAFFNGCQMPGVVGFLHNHPTGPCVFSIVDNATFYRFHHRVAIVSCHSGFAWRTISDSGFIAWGRQ